MLQLEQFDRARAFIMSNARLLDRKRYEFHFEDGSAREVLDALRVYQNKDGGFGNALEPDMRCSESQPVFTEEALLLMDEVGEFDAGIIEGIASYLQGIQTAEDGGFPRVLSSVHSAPHAPWWGTANDQEACINPTGRILGLLYKQMAIPEITREDWFHKAEEYVWRQLESAQSTDYHDLIQFISFLSHTPDRERAARHLDSLDHLLTAPGAIERDPAAEGYVHKILDFAPQPDSYCAKFFTVDEIKFHLHALISQQQADGGWPIRWPPLSPANEMEWRGAVTVNRLLTLRAYEHLLTTAD